MLIRRVAQGDDEAMTLLYTCLFPALTRFIWRRYHPPLDRQDAEDVAHETLIQVWRYASHYRGAHSDASARRWVRQIARRLALRRLEALQRFASAPLEDCTTAGPHTVAQEDPEAWVAQREAWEHFLAACTPRERQIIALRYEGLTLAEIGRRLDVSAPRVHQILRRLAERWRQHQEHAVALADRHRTS